MSYAKQLLDSYPGTLNADAGMLAATIDALSDCAQACAADADADLSEQNLAEMVKCIRLCLGCVDECARHAPHYEHCRICEQACRRCEQACRELLGIL